jgi:hypothetical protein
VACEISAPPSLLLLGARKCLPQDISWRSQSSRQGPVWFFKRSYKHIHCQAHAHIQLLLLLHWDSSAGDFLWWLFRLNIFLHFQIVCNSGVLLNIFSSYILRYKTCSFF